MNLKRYVLFVHFVDALIFLMGIYSVMLFGTSGTEHSGSLPFLVFGILLILLGVGFSLFMHRHLRRCLWTYSHVTPSPMTLNFRTEESSDSTDYFAVLESIESTEKWQVHLLPMGLKRKLVDQKDIAARVYCDPADRSPLVVETDEGVLWGMGGNAAVKRLG